MSVDLFRIRDHVPDFDAIVRDILARSARTCDTLPSKLAVPYGGGPSETLDIFLPQASTKPAPVHIFIHGGYWRMFSARDYACIADTITQAGAIAVIVDYALMPKVRMGTIVDQVRRARDWVTSNIATYGGDPARLTVSGHSAGAHLATFLFTEDQPPNIRAALLLGGLFRLEPLRSSFLQAEITLTDEEVVAFTPMTHSHQPTTRVSILVGADETTPFHEQADEFAQKLAKDGLDVVRAEIPLRNHMDSVRDLAVPGSNARNLLLDLLRQV